VRSAKPWQLTHSWTTELDMPSGRFRIIAYSPKRGVDWSVSWQETEQEALGTMIPKIVEKFQAAKTSFNALRGGCEAEKGVGGEVGSAIKGGRMPARQLRLSPTVGSSLQKSSRRGDGQ
jgi:hypothetical protein